MIERIVAGLRDRPRARLDRRDPGPRAAAGPGGELRALRDRGPGQPRLARAGGEPDRGAQGAGPGAGTLGEGPAPLVAQPAPRRRRGGRSPTPRSPPTARAPRNGSSTATALCANEGGDERAEARRRGARAGGPRAARVEPGQRVASAARRAGPPHRDVGRGRRRLRASAEEALLAPFRGLARLQLLRRAGPGRGAQPRRGAAADRGRRHRPARLDRPAGRGRRARRR